jgi:predicted NBD/HSP70 family sugar kinase
MRRTSSKEFTLPADRTDGMAAVLAAIRAAGGTTQPQLTQLVGMGRSVVAQRVAELEAAGLVVQAGVAPSTGGRAPRQIRLRPEAGLVGGADLGMNTMHVGIADLDGRMLASKTAPMDVADDPEVVLRALEQQLNDLIAQRGQPPLWGLGVGVPAPVEFDTGRPVAPPAMPAWDGYPIRDRLSVNIGAPVWVDNDVNLLALAELRTNPDAATGDLLYVMIGHGLGAGLVSGGRVHRGATGCAGAIGDVPVAGADNVICRCGKVGCLIAVAGAAALTRQARELAETGTSPMLAEILAASGSLTVADAIVAAERGDPAAQTMLARAGQHVGGTLATLVGFYNPGLVVLGGEVPASDDVVAAIRETVEQRAPSLATRSLHIERSTMGDDAGLLGAVHLVLEALFSADCILRWLPYSSPAGHPEVMALHTSVPA